MWALNSNATPKKLRRLCNILDFACLTVDIVTAFVLGQTITASNCQDYCWGLHYYYLLLIIIVVMIVVDVFVALTRFYIMEQTDSAPTANKKQSYQPLPLIYILYVLKSSLVAIFIPRLWFPFFTAHFIFVFLYTFFPMFHTLCMVLSVSAVTSDIVMIVAVNSLVQSGTLAKIYTLIYTIPALLLDVKFGLMYSWALYNSKHGAEKIKKM